MEIRNLILSGILCIAIPFSTSTSAQCSFKVAKTNRFRFEQASVARFTRLAGFAAMQQSCVSSCETDAAECISGALSSFLSCEVFDDFDACAAAALGALGDCRDALDSCTNGCSAIPPPPMGAIVSQVDPVTNGLEIYYITSNQHISTLTWNSTSANWHVSDISASIGAPAAALGGSLANIVHGSSPEVYYLGADQHIHQLFWNTVGGQPAWHTFDVSSATGATNASISNNTLAAMLDTVVGSPEVYYVGVDDDVHQLSWNSSTGWHAFNLTTLIGAPLASPFGSIMNFVDKTTNSPEAWYVGTDSHIHQDSWNSVSGWHTFDATAATNAAEAPLGGGISLLNDTLNSSPEVYYAGTDQHVHQLFWHPGAWQTFDISQSIGAANSEFGGATTSLVNTLTNALEVYYVSDDHHVWQLRWTSTTGWSKFDVSAFTGATAVTPRGALSSMLDSLTGSVEIYYVGWDQHVHQLTWNPTAGWHHFDISAMAI